MTRLVVVDGAGGFLGRHVVRALRDRGMRVRATDRPGVALPDADARVHVDLSCDPLEPLFAGATHVVHVAGLFDLAAREDALRRANVAVARRVADAAVIARVRRFVHVSSVTVYGRPRVAPVREDARRRPESAYERSKHAGEDAVGAIARASGLPLVIARPSGIYGPHGRYGLAAMASTIALAAASGRGHRSLRSETRMTHVHVEDVASACALLCDERATRDEDVLDRAFHVADATPVTWSDVARTIERFYGLEERAPVRVTPLRARAMQIAGRLASARLARTNASLARRWEALVGERGLEHALTPRIDVDAYDYWRADHVYDTSALRGLGWSPRWPDAREGLRATLEWYVRERWLPAP
ncbi:NAD-dependent epimerase/dehydratase family protein [Sandaracinus amylolyticus]|uniref:UDP-glucose 4-epimerase n=1 Tax=Sandaracinus amylolyticus TaxID=927083 RepID=A0A0F6W2Y7_9BACT|nr:NAD-dependent epimerase/dehydratase family protein [Sandaracinus amylolyticus]AKF05983.1 UDP-glucose 4-epimerase [Sandaracinus amylolyticus]